MQEALVRQYQGFLLADHGQVDPAKLQLDYTRVIAPITVAFTITQDQLPVFDQRLKAAKAAENSTKPGAAGPRAGGSSYAATLALGDAGGTSGQGMSGMGSVRQGAGGDRPWAGGQRPGACAQAGAQAGGQARPPSPPSTRNAGKPGWRRKPSGKPRSGPDSNKRKRTRP
ncbi:MAG: hypothetical protein MO853_12610 [Candidatus Protistobacter heckmanni]|nr:hypothetical protein [Candidatus Protistobacter heckmanni]